ncbi:hypothetical protein CERSUDRAFT_117412 [Gelatoporia subvermispora B]|uniref:Nucleoporin Nup54 alpha-helical domain-containing protein n=1 Tax=Ceriporiopsis subvermispora (strain B) TaxID=914234 RepID=M2R4R0_CERS8|nr:hypothetical protein CERSUDRAFT_117412 [Gelatoporia subvermispora B]
MAFAANSSAFGIKPAGTTGTSIFGNNNATQPQGSSIFGGANTSQPTTSTFGGFGAQPQTQPNQPQTQGTSIFGGPLGQNAQQQQTQGTSLFGSTLGQYGQQQQQKPPSLFGSGTFGQTQQPSQNQTTNIFGQPSTNNQPQQSTLGTSIFGNNQNQPNQQSTLSGLGSLGGTSAGSTFASWGSTTTNPLQPQATQPASAFGSGLGASTLFGKQPMQQPMLATTQASGAPPFTKSTKFNDLPDDVKRVFENIDSVIQGRIQISNDLKERKLGDEAAKGQELVRSVHKDLVNAITTLHTDAHHTRDLKAKVDQTVHDTIIATRVVDGFRNPQQHGAHLKNHANFPLEFFTRVTEQMRERLRWYKATIEQIERKLSSAASQAQYTPQAITSTLEAQHASFAALAAKAATLHDELQQLKALYTQLWRAKTGSMRDPFDSRDRDAGGEFGLSGIGAE